MSLAQKITIENSGPIRARTSSVPACPLFMTILVAMCLGLMSLSGCGGAKTPQTAKQGLAKNSRKSDTQNRTDDSDPLPSIQSAMPKLDVDGNSGPVEVAPVEVAPVEVTPAEVEPVKNERSSNNPSVDPGPDRTEESVLGKGDEPSGTEGGEQAAITRAKAARPKDDAKVRVIKYRELTKLFGLSDGVPADFRTGFIEVSGDVLDFGCEQGFPSFHPLIFMKDEDHYDRVPLYTVEREPWGIVSIGQRVKLRGWYDNSQGFIFEIVELGEPTGINISSIDFAKEVLQDQDAAFKRFRNHSVIVTGKLLRIVPHSSDSMFLELEGHDKHVVNCFLRQYDKSLLKILEVGKPVTIIGETIDIVNKICVPLNRCFAVTKKAASNNGLPSDEPGK